MNILSILYIAQLLRREAGPDPQLHFSWAPPHPHYCFIGERTKDGGHWTLYHLLHRPVLLPLDSF